MNYLFLIFNDFPAMSTYGSDIYQLASNEDPEPSELEEWQVLLNHKIIVFHLKDLNIDFVFQGLPVAVLWYSFLLVALQVHFFEVYFSTLLIRGLRSIQK